MCIVSLNWVVDCHVEKFAVLDWKHTNCTCKSAMEIKAVIKNTFLLALKDSFWKRPDGAEITWRLHNTLSHANGRDN